MLRLEADGQPQSLVTVYEVDKPTSVQRALFKHLNIWSDLWVARFASTVEDPRLVELHVGSGYGNGTLSWDLAGLRPSKSHRGFQRDRASDRVRAGFSVFGFRFSGLRWLQRIASLSDEPRGVSIPTGR